MRGYSLSKGRWRLRFAVFASVVLVLGVAACGGGDQPDDPQAAAPAPTATNQPPSEVDKDSDGDSARAGGESRSTDDAELARRPTGEEGLRVPAVRARIVAKDSAFGRVLFDANGQVVYVFENDRRKRSNCTSLDCVDAWPPVLSRRPPSAGAGAKARLLGTIRRADGTLQVTYNGRPLYFYAHEAPGEIKCHNIDLHGGLWWVVTARGDPAN
jgi:predicted lipoprotein with Yx(FWY)xxD motif